MIKFLILEDNLSDLKHILRVLRKSDLEFEFHHVNKGDEFLSSLNTTPPDIVLSDYNLPSFSGREAFEAVKESGLCIPIILITGTISDAEASEMLHLGIDDYFLKDRMERLPNAIQQALIRKKLEKERVEFTKNLEFQVAERTKELEEKNSSLATKNKDITDSINYALRLQKAIFPEVRRLKNVFPESFIYLKPKDIVSGDFYWFHEENEYFIIAGADCTGHGVPGAFMSMMGIEQLKKAVIEHQLVQVHSILEDVDIGLEKSLRASPVQGVNDGIDIALCSIRKQENVIEISNAARPVFLISEGKLTIFKAGKFSLGGVMERSQKAYPLHQTKYKDNDMLYIFSDGYSDQFGGPSGRKLMSRSFKDLLMSICHLSCDEQHEKLHSFMHDWMGKEGQVDDILVMGIRL